MRRGESARRRGALRAIAVFGALPAATSGCLAPTDITLDVTSDLPCSKLEGIAITAGLQGTVESERAPSAVTKSCTADGHGGSFGTLVLTPSSGPDSEIAVRVVAGVSPTPASACNEENAYMGCIVVRRVLHYDAHTPLTLPIEVRDACVGVTCVGEDTTCVEGICRSAKIDDPSQCIGDGCSEAKLFAGATTPSCLGDLDFVGLGSLPGRPDSSFGSLSADGGAVFAFSSTISGGVPDSDDAHAFRCASPDERSAIVGPDEHPFVPTATDGTGSVVAGFDVPSKAHITAVRWSAGQAITLPSRDSRTTVRGCDRSTCAVLVGTIDLAPVLWRSPSHAPAVLRGPDGTVLEGSAAGVDPTGRFAFGTLSGVPGVWDLSMNTWRGTVPEEGSAKVLAATPDGSRLVGYTGDVTIPLHPVLWTAIDPWQSYTLKKLQPPPGASDKGLVTAVSDDGAIVTGLCGVAGASVATLWEASSGFAPVRVSDRVDAPPGWELQTAWVSADGKIVAGDALNHHHFEPYIARLK